MVVREGGRLLEGGRQVLGTASRACSGTACRWLGGASFLLPGGMDDGKLGSKAGHERAG